MNLVYCLVTVIITDYTLDYTLSAVKVRWEKDKIKLSLFEVSGLSRTNFYAVVEQIKVSCPCK